MGGWEKVLRWLWPVESLPYEQLFENYARVPGLVLEEFDRRLWRTVFRIGVDQAQKEGLIGPALEARAEELADQAFASFEPQFDGGEARFGLARFAECLRGVMGSEAFQENARMFYLQLPLYYLGDYEQRDCLAKLLERGMSEEAFRELADMKEMTVEELERLVEAANESLKRVMRDEFDDGELAELTEGYLR